jgi:hypothetical protein
VLSHLKDLFQIFVYSVLYSQFLHILQFWSTSLPCSETKGKFSAYSKLESFLWFEGHLKTKYIVITNHVQYTCNGGREPCALYSPWFLSGAGFPGEELLQRASRSPEELLRFRETILEWLSFPLDHLKIRKNDLREILLQRVYCKRCKIRLLTFYCYTALI